MGFSFKRKEPVPKAVRRIIAERIEAALKSLGDYHRAKAIHGVRKDIKKVRAVLRLAKGHISKKTYRRQTELLRKAADRLAPTRDAHVKGAALKNLSDRFHDQSGRRALRQFGKELGRELAQAEKRFARKESARKVRRLLRRIPKGLQSLEFDSNGWNAISAGVKTAFTHGRQAYLVSRKEPSPEHLHEWRKRVKDLWYQVRVLGPICRERLDPLAAKLKRLSEYLGEDHDLFMLRQSVQTDADDQGELFSPSVLRGMIEQRRRELQQAAFETGAQLYAETPSEFHDRLAQDWKAWRDGKKRARAAI